MRARVERAKVVAAAAFAMACWAPEKFEATLSVDKNRQYEFTYDGTIAFGPALVLIKQRGQLSASEEQELRNGVAQLRREPGVIAAEYVGRGRVRIQFREGGAIKPGKSLFLDLVEFRSDPTGGIRIVGAEIPLEVQQQMAGVGLRLDGRVRLRSKIPVVQHNATRTPWLGSRFGAYQWRVTSAQAEYPTVLLR